jgi:hypothetical protein
MTISALGECIERSKAHLEKTLKKLSVFGEYGEFTVVGLSRTRLRIRFMKLSILGEYAE